MAEVDEESLGLGDFIVIIGGSLNKTRGKIYEFTEQRLSILPLGATDRLIKIDLIDGLPDPDLGISEILLVKRSPKEGFISLIDLRAGQTIETFREGPFGSLGPQAGPVLKVVSVNEDNDSAVFQDETGGEVEINFDFSGIPRELGYEVMRTREAEPASEGSSASASVKEEVQGQKHLDILPDEEDVAQDGQVQSPEEEAQEEEQEPEFIIGEIIELKKVQGEIKEISSAFRIYQDIFQRSEMLGELIRSLPQKLQRNPIKLQEIRRIVELMIILRNDVVKYGVTGEPRGLKPTSMETLADLVKKPDVTLARKVADVSKVLCATHTEEPDKDPPAGPYEEGLYLDYLEDILQQAKTLDATAAMEPEGGEPATGLPRFFINSEKYIQKVQTPFIIQQGEEPIAADEEVFRLEVPDLEENSLNALGISMMELPPIITQIPFSQARLLKRRISRFTVGEELRVVEKGENPAYNNIIVFPRTALRTVGPIRSGSLARDASLAMSPAETMEELLKRLGEISDFPSADGILLLGVDGNILGNVLVKDWLENLNLLVNGIGDTLLELRGYGASNVEWSVAQLEVIQGKINQHLAAIKIFITRQREENKSALANIKFEAQPLFPADISSRLLARIESEPLLQKVLEKVREATGDLADIDVNWFTFLFLSFPDLLVATLGQQPDILAKERLRHVRDQYNNSLKAGYRLKRVIQNSGEIPQENTCEHVAELDKVRRLGQRYAEEPRDTTKTKGLLKLLNKFRGRVEENWVWCNVCDKHLICGHELLQVQELLRPKEKEALQKELILKFSGGQFGGKFICSVCGQGIQELDFDTNIEFDDAGRPMMGRAVLVDEDAIKDEQLNAMLTGFGVGGGQEEEEKTVYATEELNTMYTVFKKISSLVGINPEPEDLKKMVEDLNNYITGLPTRDAYAAASRGKKAQDYDIWYSIRYVSAAAAIMLLNIQTHAPDYIIYYTNADCREGFFGYPLESESNTSGLNCITTVIAGINENEFPWNLTTLQKQSNLVKRRDAILPFVKNQIDAFIKFPVNQAALKKKRDYRISLYGTSEGIKKDQIPQIFRPVPYIISVEEAAAAPVIASAATPSQQATAWIRTGHSVARTNAALNPDSPFSETTTCLHQVGTPSELSSASSASLPALEKRTARMRNSATVSSTFYTEKQKTLEGRLDPKDYYKLFAQVCYEGPNKGLPHQLGVGLACSQCEISFQENPKLSSSSSAGGGEGEGEAGDLKLKSHIESQGIIINDDTFDDLLRSARLAQGVSEDPLTKVPRPEDAFEFLAKYPPMDTERWVPMLNKISVSLAELSVSTPLTKIQIAQAAEELVGSISVKEEFVKARIGENLFSYIGSILQKPPRECGEAVSTYLLVPYQKWLSGLGPANFRILGTYNLSSDTKADILTKGMGSHLQIIGGEELTGIGLAKVQLFVKDLSSACRNIFPSLRSILMFGGKEMVTYFMRAYLIGAIHRFIDPHQIPETDLDTEGTVPNMKLLYKSLGQALTRYAVGSKVPTEEEIRTRIEQRVEQEKQVFINKLDRMSREERKVELMLKGLGMGAWAAGGSKAIRQYDEDRYEVERAERAAAGIVDYAGQGPLTQAQGEAQTYDMFGFAGNAGDGGEGEGGEGEGGYDHDQMAEDDY
jgi:hypothetical protein